MFYTVIKLDGHLKTREKSVKIGSRREGCPIHQQIYAIYCILLTSFARSVP
jgi:hypothetical protein